MSMGCILTLCPEVNFACVYIAIQMCPNEHEIAPEYLKFSWQVWFSFIVVVCEWWYLLNRSQELTVPSVPEVFYNLVCVEARAAWRNRSEYSAAFSKGTLVLLTQCQKSVLLLSEAALIQKKGRNWNASFSGSWCIFNVFLATAEIMTNSTDFFQALFLQKQFLTSVLALLLACHYRFLLEGFISRMLGCDW